MLLILPQQKNKQLEEKIEKAKKFFEDIKKTIDCDCCNKAIKMIEELDK